MLNTAAFSKEIAKIRSAMPRGSLLECQLSHAEPAVVELRAIRVFETGTGAGTRAMRSLIELCDYHDLAIFGTVDPTDDPDDPDTNTLLRWYQGLGFQVVGMDLETDQPLIRRPAGARQAPRSAP